VQITIIPLCIEHLIINEMLWAHFIQKKKTVQITLHGYTSLLDGFVKQIFA